MKFTTFRMLDECVLATIKHRYFRKMTNPTHAGFETSLVAENAVICSEDAIRIYNITINFETKSFHIKPWSSVAFAHITPHMDLSNKDTTQAPAPSEPVTIPKLKICCACPDSKVCPIPLRR